MDKRSVICWNIDRLFGSKGSPIAYALSNEGNVNILADQEDIEQKILTISGVIDRIAEIAGPPLLVGLVEIENTELSQGIAKNIRSASLATVDAKATDETGFALDGLNISLLFDVNYFDAVEKIHSHVITRTFNTRDILECDFSFNSGNKLSILVNHWPSRLVGEAAGQRITAAHYARSILASKVRFTLVEMWDKINKSITVPESDLLQKRAEIPVIVMGDFNDEMFDESIELLGSTNDQSAVLNDLKVKGESKKERFRSYVSSTPLLFNPFWTMISGGGSYYRSPRWRCYDQILLSRGLLIEDNPIQYIPDSAHVFSEIRVTRSDGSSMQLTNAKGKPITYNPKKHCGCSDHLPVFISLNA